MSALEEVLSQIAHAAVTEQTRAERWDDLELAAEFDELAARRRLRDETDRYPTRAAEAEARGEAEHEKDLRGGF